MPKEKGKTASKEVELKDIGVVAASFSAKAQKFLESLDSSLFSSEVKGFGLGGTITRKSWNEEKKSFDKISKIGVPHTVREIHDAIAAALSADNTTDYLRGIAKVESLLNDKLIEYTASKNSKKVELFQSLYDKIQTFKEQNKSVLVESPEYQGTLSDLDFDRRVMGDHKNGKEYLKFKAALALQEEGLRRTKEFLSQNQKSLVKDGTNELLNQIVDCILQTYDHKDLSIYHARAMDLINNHCPSLSEHEREAARVAFKTLVDKHEAIMNKIDTQWKDFYVRTMLAIVSTVVSPIVGTSVPADVVQNISTVVGGTATAGKIVSTKLTSDDRILHVAPKQKSEDVASALWNKKGSIALSGAETLTGIVLGLTLPPVAAAFAGAQLVKSVIAIGGTTAKEIDILKARENASVNILNDNTEKYNQFKEFGKEMDTYKPRPSQSGLFKHESSQEKKDKDVVAQASDTLRKKQ